eukprot:718917-Pleurochrysis_carterae.AAC.1
MLPRRRPLPPGAGVVGGVSGRRTCGLDSPCRRSPHLLRPAGPHPTPAPLPECRRLAPAVH